MILANPTSEESHQYYICNPKGIPITKFSYTASESFCIPTLFAVACVSVCARACARVWLADLSQWPMTPSANRHVYVRPHQAGCS